MVRELLEHAICSLVNEPSAVSVTSVLEDDKQIFEIHVAQQDVGKVIGKGGQNLKALRLLVHALLPDQHYHLSVAGSDA